MTIENDDCHDHRDGSDGHHRRQVNPWKLKKEYCIDGDIFEAIARKSQRATAVIRLVNPR